MHPSTTSAPPSWHVEHATSLPEIWARIAVFAGPVGAWQLTGVCRAAREGVKGHLRSLPGLVVVNGGVWTATGLVSDVWRLDLASLQWESMAALVPARVTDHVCCAVGGSVAVIGGRTLVGNDITETASVEAISSREEAVYVNLPPLSCGGIWAAAAIAVEESDSAAGQVLLLGGSDSSYDPLSRVQLVDLATGMCTVTTAPPPLRARISSGGTAARRSRGLRGGRLRWRVYVVGGGFGPARAGRAGRSMDLDRDGRHVYRAVRLQWMRDERRPLRRPRWGGRCQR
jgi:hypothetical protein